MDPRTDQTGADESPAAVPAAKTDEPLASHEEQDAGPAAAPDRTVVPHAGLKYLALRTLLLLAVGAVLYLLGLRGLLLAVLAFLISGAISLFALSRSRIAAAGNLDHRISKVNRRIEARAAAEDVD